MSGFDKEWLALREPADRAARAPELVAVLAAHLGAGPEPRLLDIGCGTGSTWRSLSGALPKGAGWLLLDYDPALLAEAARRIGPAARVGLRQHDMTDLAGLPLEGVDMVTASALFDLCSEEFCAAFTALLAKRGCGLYAALNYDGTMRWSVPHPLDAQVVADFNSHQHGDKGFGPALGPDAAPALKHLLEARGYRVTLANSPWRMGRGEAALQRAFLDGLRAPLAEIGTLSEVQIADWLTFRLAEIETPESTCEVGHLDLLALPG